MTDATRGGAMAGGPQPGGFADHLNLDAIVAFADGEMPLVGYQRAATHLARCPQCAGEVDQQLAARSFLRSAQSPAMPAGLLDSLRSIPVAVPRPSTQAGQAPRPAPPAPPLQHPSRGRRIRFLGTSAVVAGLAVGALGAAEISVVSHRPAESHVVSGVSTPFALPVSLGRP